MSSFHSDAKQDQFASIIVGDKKNGFYVDIGSHHSEKSNNTYYFSKIGWGGICVEIDANHRSSYFNRDNCKIIIDDATKICYKELLKDSGGSLSIDYMSLDVDVASLDVLRLFPFEDFLPKVVTIEHDAYLYGDIYREPQRKILKSFEYILFASNVFVEQDGYEGSECPFEDWWVDKEFLMKSPFRDIRFDNKLPSFVIESLKSLQNGKDKTTIC